ncbi:MAG TPA: hypothetical protein PJ988_21075, partial [Anaerolinea sp.]|nr:hypothetical protein [Anaerolinea sp.]
RLERLSAVQDFTRGLSLGVVGLTLAVTAGLAQSAVVDLRGVLIALGALGLAVSKRVPVILILILAAAVGLLLYR